MKQERSASLFQSSILPTRAFSSLARKWCQYRSRISSSIGRLPALCHATHVPRLDLGQRLGQRVFGDRAVVIVLQTGPEPFGSSEEPRQAQTGVRCHRTLAGDDLTYPALRDTDLLGESILSDLHRLQKLLDEDFAGSGIRNRAHGVSRWVSDSRRF